VKTLDLWNYRCWRDRTKFAFCLHPYYCRDERVLMPSRAGEKNYLKLTFLIF